MEDQLMNFLAITNCQNPENAQKFLEMSGGNMEVRITSKQLDYFLKQEKTDYAEDQMVAYNFIIIYYIFKKLILSYLKKK